MPIHYIQNNTDFHSNDREREREGEGERERQKESKREKLTWCSTVISGWRERERERGKWRQLQQCTFSIWVRQKHFQTVNEVCAIKRVTTNPDTKRLTQTNLCCLVHSFICQRPGSRNNTWKIRPCICKFPSREWTEKIKLTWTEANLSP